MVRAYARPLALALLLGLLLVCPFACADKAPPAPRAAAPPPAPEPVDTTTPREVELSDATIKFRDERVVVFEVKYRFTKGQPQPGYEYRLDATFPGTTNSGLKPLVGREVGKEGVLKDGFQLQQPGAKTFEFTLLEAPSPMHPFKTISNVVRGTIQ